jgi:hypothetical protein
MPKYGWYEGSEYMLNGKANGRWFTMLFMGQSALGIKTDAQFTWCGR